MNKLGQRTSASRFIPIQRVPRGVALALLVALCVLSGCGPGQPTNPPAAPMVTLQTDYGLGYDDYGFTIADPNVSLNVTNADPLCTSGPYNLASGSTDPNGNISFVPTCNPQYIQIIRYVSSNCQYTNELVGGVEAFVYNSFDAYAPSSPPYRLPCGDTTVDVVLSPGSMAANEPVTQVQMSAAAGSFSSNFGMPQVYFIDDSGQIDGTVTATSMASDGSSITFPIWPLVNEQNLAVPGSYIMQSFNAIPNVDPEVQSLSPGAGALFTVTPPVYAPIPKPVLPCATVQATTVQAETAFNTATLTTVAPQVVLPCTTQ